jgi:hypothetical protein
VDIFNSFIHSKGQKDIEEGDIVNIDFVCKEAIAEAKELRLRRALSSSGFSSSPATYSNTNNRSRSPQSSNNSNSNRSRSDNNHGSMTLNTVQAGSSSLEGFKISLKDDMAKGKEFKLVEGEQCSLCGTKNHTHLTCNLATEIGELSLIALARL